MFLEVLKLSKTVFSIDVYGGVLTEIDCFTTLKTVDLGYKTVDLGYKTVEFGYKTVEFGYKQGN